MLRLARTKVFCLILSTTGVVQLYLNLALAPQFQSQPLQLDYPVTDHRRGFYTGKLSARDHNPNGERERSQLNEHVRASITVAPPQKYVNKKSDDSSRDVIVYLAQFSQFHSSYGITRPVDTLNRSLELLYENYVNKFPTDVIIFHDSVTGPSNVTRTSLSAAYPNLEFRCLRKRDWSLPHGLKAWQHMFWNRPQFSVGYRLMMRWYAVLIWFYLSEEGYTHVMRMDDDSYITSQIRYNLFGFMRQNNKRYAFRQPTVDDGVGRGYNELIDKFLDDHPNVTPPAQIELYKKERYLGFYNNWFMADVSFFLSQPAISLLLAIDESNLIFTQRTGDLVIQSTLVRLFLQPAEVHWFQDFTYEHMTLCKKEKCGLDIPRGCPQNGGMSRGLGQYSDKEWAEVVAKKVKNRFRGLNCIISIGETYVGAKDVRDCQKLSSRCGFYLQLLDGANETAKRSTWQDYLTSMMAIADADKALQFALANKSTVN